MTRFMMSMEESVSLVEFAFANAKSGDIFVQKAPAATILTLAKALLSLFNADNGIQYIGTRHGEKLYETLITKEEMQSAEDMGKYYRIPADGRDLNYAQYFTEGQVSPSTNEDYHSHNTEKLDLDGMKKMLIKLKYIQQELNIFRSYLNYQDLLVHLLFPLVYFLNLIYLIFLRIEMFPRFTILPSQ